MDLIVGWTFFPRPLDALPLPRDRVLRMSGWMGTLAPRSPTDSPRALGPRLEVILLLAIYAASRAAWVLLAPRAGFFAAVEGWRGVIGHQILQGSVGDLFDWRADDYSGGSLVVGVLAALSFRLFGHTVLALKLVPLAFSSVALLAWYMALRREAGAVAARCFAVLFIASPPSWTYESMLAMGYHAETVAISALSLVLLVGYFRDPTSGSRPAVLGLVAGFGLWFNYSYGVVLLGLLPFLACAPPVGERFRHAVCFAAGFLIGFSGWLAFNLTHHLAGLSLLSGPVWGHFGLGYGIQSLGDPRATAPWALLRSFAWPGPDPFGHRAVNVGYTALLTLPLAGLITRRGQNPPGQRLVVLCGVVLALYLAIVHFSSLREVRYLVPAYPFLFALASCGVCRLERRFHGAALLFAAAAVSLALAAHTVAIPFHLSIGRLREPGYSYSMLPATLCVFRREPACVDRSLRLAAELPGRSRREVLGSLTVVLAFRLTEGDLAAELRRTELLLPQEFHPLFLHLLGRRVHTMTGDLRRARSIVEGLLVSAPLRRSALDGVYWDWSANVDPREVSAEEAGRRLAEGAAPHDYWRAFGARSVWSSDGDLLASLRPALRIVETLAAEREPETLDGMGRALAWRLFWWRGLDIAGRRDVLALHALSADRRLRIWEGAGREVGPLPGCRAASAWRGELERVLSGEELKAFDRGALAPAIRRPCAG